MIEAFRKLANEYGGKGIPFLFILDFELKRPVLYRLDEAAEHGVYFHIPGSKLLPARPSKKQSMNLKVQAMAYKDYERAFMIARQHLNAGDTYLINITFPTKIEIDLTLAEIFMQAEAPYKLLYKDRFTLFSPECFVRTRNGHIYSYPMKGTIDASVPNAAQTLLSNKKETWEHNTIVDLIRNDLAMVARNITVTKYRFLSEIHSIRKDLLQVSSEIRGDLGVNWQGRIGDILSDLLPAGSISGAPKKRTVEIIREAEGQDRGYFTGVFGVFDGRELDSAVNIRYIEKVDDRLQFRSGGGITAMSACDDEYNEMKDKVYVPIP